MATSSGQARRSSRASSGKAASKAAASSRASATKTRGGKDASSRQADLAKGLDKELLLKLYEDMLLIRRFEEKAGQMYGMGLIGGFCHLYIGQEAVVVGLQSCITADDGVVTSYRDHGHMLATGMESNGVMAELTGRRTGYSKCKGGSMHMFSIEKKFFGGHGIVGAQVPIGTGLAFAHKYRGDGGVTMAYYGDGAANQGQVYESFNMAALWKLPVVYIIENNRYGMGTSVERASATTELYRHGEAFGIPGERVDGMDVLAVRAIGEKAVEHAPEDGLVRLHDEDRRALCRDAAHAADVVEVSVRVPEVSDPPAAFLRLCQNDVAVPGRVDHGRFPGFGVCNKIRVRLGGS